MQLNAIFDNESLRLKCPWFSWLSHIDFTFYVGWRADIRLRWASPCILQYWPFLCIVFKGVQLIRKPFIYHLPLGNSSPPHKHQLHNTGPQHMYSATAQVLRTRYGCLITVVKTLNTGHTAPGPTDESIYFDRLVVGCLMTNRLGVPTEDTHFHHSPRLLLPSVPGTCSSGAATQ